jgi:hypothetical protein
MRIYKDEQDAAKGILGEAVKIISQSNVDYVVVGGWIPFLFYSSIYPHPGSFDVDLLLNDNTTKEQMEKAVDVFKENGYHFAAKNKFQLHKILNVAGEEIIFHVDFLHRKYAPDQEDGFFLNWNKMLSIAGPGTDIIFLDNERTSHDLTFDLPDNTTETFFVNFANEVGFISAKGRALDTPKRVRDSYDIFVIICQTKDYNTLLHKSYEYYHSKEYYKSSIDNIYRFFTEGKGIENTKRFIEKYKDRLKYLPENLDQFIAQKVIGFIDKVRTK